MDMQAYLDEIKLQLTGYLIDIELDDMTLTKIVESAFRELQRYIGTTRLATILYQPCIDLKGKGISAVTKVYRASGYMGVEDVNSQSLLDPMYAAQWQMYSNTAFNTGAFSNWVMNYGAWNTMLQMRNTLSTDLAFRYDKQTERLYVNVAFDKPTYITIEYIPRFESVDEINSDYWIDILVKLSVALTKVTLGRVRSRHKLSNAIWDGDGSDILEEGKTELETLREQLRTNSMMFYPID